MAFFRSKKEIEEQINTLANFELLRRFIGMLTDSRSILSITKHKYFRRILCNLIGELVEEGEIPDDEEILKSMINEI
ncbi:glucuronate isomerase [Fusobacterium sp. FSA-380-WT-3A]|nr:glucuronate isomerase [Fusobacterium sp. FSA-380-WT-3A]